jgi:hypothetical protein
MEQLFWRSWLDEGRSIQIHKRYLKQAVNWDKIVARIKYQSNIRAALEHEIFTLQFKLIKYEH